MSFVRPKNTMITVNSAVMSFTESECITVQNIKSESMRTTLEIIMKYR